MPDVAIGSKTPELYGILAASTGDNARQVVAIRGTATVTEWWDNIHFLPVPFQNVRGGGHVSEGFNEIYQGMTSTDPRDRTAATSPLFEHIDPGIPLVVTGHSLGGALVTLMALDMFVNSDLQPEVWTLGSPKVGDAQFAATYGQHSHVSWRIYNIPDVIPKVPIDPFDNYQDVNTGYPINSGHLTRLSLGCFHHLTTYMSVLSGGTVPLDPSCT
jgi:predicted lipase